MSQAFQLSVHTGPQAALLTTIDADMLPVLIQISGKMTGAEAGETPAQPLKASDVCQTCGCEVTFCAHRPSTPANVLHALIDQVLREAHVAHEDCGLPKSYETSMGWIVRAMRSRNQILAQQTTRAEQAEERLKQITDLLGMPPGCSAGRGGS
jgi:hypothetical protein